MKKNIVYSVWPWCNDPEIPDQCLISNSRSDKFVSDILEHPGNCHFVYAAPEEFALQSESYLRSTDLREQFLDHAQHIGHRQIDISIITGRFHKQPESAFGLDDFINSTAEHVNIYYWPTFWMFSAFTDYLNNRVDMVKNYPDISINRAFTCLNGKPHRHRCEFMDLLCQHELIEQNLVSWVILREQHCAQVDYTWRYWSEELIVHEEFNIENGAPQYPQTDPAGYYHTLLDVITETSEDVVFWTEKTVRPLLLQRPFLIVGAQYANSWLRELGFELFEEFIDYEFDRLEKCSDRIENVVAQLKDLSQRTDHNQLRRSVEHKIKHNQQRLIQLAQDPKQIPLKHILSENIDKYDRILHKNHQMINKLSL